MKTLQIFNVYQQYGGEENIVRSLSALMQGPDWADLYFRSEDWTREPSFKKLTQPLRAFYNSAALRAARAAHEAHQPDVWLLHNVLPVGSLGLYHMAARLGVPVIKYVHNYRPFSPGGTAWHDGKILDQGFRGNFWPEVAAGTYRGSRLQTLFVSLLLKAYFKTGAFDAVTSWLAPTEFQKAKFVEAGIDPERIEVMLPPRRLEPPPAEWRDEGYLLFLGRLVPEKGVLFLLDQWAEAERSGRTLPELVIAGGGPLEKEVKERAAKLPKVRYLGHVGAEERRRLLAGCSAVVAPSQWWEVMGMVVFEAYEMEKPVLAARIGGLGEIVRHGQTGFQFQPGDAADFLRALAALQACSLNQRHEMGRQGRRWLQAETDPETWMQRYAGLVARTVELKRLQKEARADHKGRRSPHSSFHISHSSF